MNKYYAIFSVAGLFVIFFLALYLRSTSIMANIGKINREILSLRTEIAKLESTYFDLSHNISKEKALAVGLSGEKGEVKYIKKDEVQEISFANQK